MHTQVDSLLKKEMTRKEFVATVSFGVASLMGLGSIMKLLGSGSAASSHKVLSTKGYGSSPYGS